MHLSKPVWSLNCLTGQTKVIFGSAVKNYITLTDICYIWDTRNLNLVHMRKTATLLLIIFCYQPSYNKPPGNYGDGLLKQLKLT